MRKYCCLLLVLSLMTVLSACGCRNDSDPEAARTLHVLDLLGIDPVGVDDIFLSYKDQSVPMTEGSRLHLLEALLYSEPCEVESEHIFAESDYLVTFSFVIEDIQGNGEPLEAEASFTWFPYYRLDKNGKYSSPETRFDLTYLGTVFHYRFVGEKLWMEAMSADEFEKQSSALHLKHRYELDGYDGIYRNVAIDYAGKSPYIPTLDFLMENTRDIVILKYEGQVAGGLPDIMVEPFYYDRFTVVEILRNEEAETGFVTDFYSGEVEFVNLYGAMNPEAAGNTVRYAERPYEYEVGCEYVYFGTVYKDSEYIDDLYLIALIEDGVLQPVFNAENHPLYNVPLETIREGSGS